MSNGKSEFQEKILLMRHAGFSVVYIYAPEDVRCIEVLASTFRECAEEVSLWTVLKGWAGNGLPPNSCQGDPVSAIISIGESTPPGIYILQGAAFALRQSPEMTQAIKDAIGRFKAENKLLLLVNPVLVIPPELEKDLTVIRFKLPNRDEMTKLCTDLVENYKQLKPEGNEQRLAVFNKTVQGLTKSKILSAAEAALGMTELEAENAFALSIVSKRELDAEMIRREKAEAVKRSDILEIFEGTVGMSDVGGMGNLKAWLKSRERAYGPEGRNYGLPAPRGILLVGCPGTGKSWMAKSIAGEWGVPLVKLDIGRIFQSLVGQSESRMRQAIELAETIGRSVLLLDEADRGLAGSGSSGNLDSGVTSRVMGTLLTWMQEKGDSQVFVVCTANRPESLPPEFMRAGRLDCIFYVGLPNISERQEILEIHIKLKTGKTSKELKLDLKYVAQKTDGFSGSELESLVTESMFTAAGEGYRNIATGDLVDAAGVTIPLSISQKDKIDAMRSWAKVMARPARSTAKPVEDVSKKMRRMQ